MKDAQIYCTLLNYSAFPSAQSLQHIPSLYHLSTGIIISIIPTNHEDLRGPGIPQTL